MLPLKYTYLVATIISFIIWLVLYLHRKDLRREMMVMGILFAILGSVFEYFWWTKDWWRPLTITETRIGIEDLLLGFTSAGIAAVLYEELFKKRMYRYKSNNHNLGLLAVIILSYLVFSIIFYYLRLNSFMATTVMQITVGIVLIVLRKDLFWDAFFTGVSIVVSIIPLYLLLEYLSPNFLENTWLWSSLSGIKFLKIPIEDLIFYFLGGFSLAPFYLYWKSEKLRKFPKGS